ncbi:MAG: DUF4190 domain-containing protein [Planctomycetaceae bacterium]|nr:DUF4190 domain-containing protein [Planctomycetaceae bacterium]
MSIKNRAGALAVTALVVAGIGVLTSVFLIGMVLSAVALVLGIIAIRRNARAGRATRIPWAAATLSAAGLVLGAVTIVLVVIPAIHEAHHSACQVNFKAMGAGIWNYQRSRGHLPQRMSDVVEGGFLEPRVFACMEDDSWREGYSSYFHYLDPDRQEHPPQALFACDSRPRHKKGRNILTICGNLGFTEEEEFQQLLARPENAAFAAALREFEASGATHFPLDRPLAATRPAP